MALAFSSRHPNAGKAMANWERKSSYLLREIVKFRTYIDVLTLAGEERRSVRERREEEEKKTVKGEDEEEGPKGEEDTEGEGDSPETKQTETETETDAKVDEREESPANESANPKAASSDAKGKMVAV